MKNRSSEELVETPPKRQLTQFLLFLIVGVTMGAVFLGAVLWLNFQRAETEKESQAIAAEYRASWEKSIRFETQRIASYIDSKTVDGPVVFYQAVKAETLAAYKALFSLTEEELKANETALLKFAGEFKDAKGRPRYFILDLEGRLLSQGGQRAAPNAEIQEIVASLPKKGEGFYRYDFAGLWPDKTEKPASFLKIFKPLGWILGSSGLFSESQSQAKEDILRWAGTTPSPYGTILLILDFNGQVIFSHKSELMGQNIFTATDPLLAKGAQEVIQGAKTQNTGLLEFFYQDDTDQVRKALGYYQTILPWDWVVLNYNDQGELEEALAHKRAELLSRVKGQALSVLVFFVCVLLLTAVLGRYVAHKARRSFENFYYFFENAATSSIEMNPDSQPFDEFSHLARSVNRMVAQKREARAYLAASEAKFRTVFDYSPLLIVITDQEERLVEANAEFASFVGQGLGDVLGHNLETYFPVESLLRQKIRAEVVAKGSVVNQELEVTNKEGNVIKFLFTSKSLPIGDERFFLSIFVDITALKDSEKERMRLQEKLARSQKMEAMGLMAARVAHELNNILSGLVGYPELLLRDNNLNFNQKELIAEIMEAGQRAAAVVSDLLTLAKGLATTRAPVNLNELVEEVLESKEAKELLARQKRPISFAVGLEKDGVQVSGSLSHLKKIVSNIVQNAIEAVGGQKDPEGAGLITVTTRKVFLKEPLETMDRFQPGEYALFAVRDNGPGVNPQEVGRIFEPFYSRKTATGLGLAVVAIIAKEHEGGVELENSPYGAEFRVYLPLLPEVKPKSALKVSEEFRGHGEMILVVDDVDIQRKLAQKMLKTLGYETHSVASGEEAVEYLKSHEADLVILDMIMHPGLNGRETYEAILAFKPGQKAIIASGMADGDEVERAQALGAKRFVSKPYSLEDIAGAVHSAINSQ
ncbi:MAG: cache domain-containing protein [Deltaproteobacteria bacterium]|jgi:PAS domain S-box-containing protein|nr:cache domain-containing protein [Deltaproteobacteria bacterium]